MTGLSMRRDDTTTEEYQRAWRGRHMMSMGNWAYPHKMPSGRIRHRRHYIRCSCGWRLVNVPPVGSKGMGKAARLYAEHFQEVQP